jgi:hypothetical protein
VSNFLVIVALLSSIFEEISVIDFQLTERHFIPEHRILLSINVCGVLIWQKHNFLTHGQFHKFEQNYSYVV